MSYKRKIKNFLLFPAVQLSLIFSGFLISLTTFTIFWLNLRNTFQQLEMIGQQLKFNPEGGYFKLLVSQQNLIYKNLLLFGLLGALISALVLLMLSHKVVGPIYRLQHYFESIIQNDGKLPPEPLTFRRFDFFGRLAQTINVALKNLKK